MNFVLLLLNLFIISVSFTLLTILKKYLREIPLDKQFIRHKILIDLANLTLAFTGSISLPMTIRQIIGPFHHVFIVETLMFFVQSLYDLVLACIVSVQITQVLSVFYSAKMSEIREELLVVFHRIFILILGLFTSFSVCYLKGWMCKPTALYFFLLQDYEDLPDYPRSSVNAFSIFLFIVAIIVCQGAIEVRRYQVHILISILYKYNF